MRFRVYEKYVIVDDVIISYLGMEKKIRVPSVINDVKIRKIGAGAFYGNEFAEEIEVTEGIAEIGDEAFGGCNKLRKVILPGSVEIISGNAFMQSDIVWLDFHIKMPYLKYFNVKEGSIRLTDGRYILDPMALGDDIGKLIKGFMPEAMKGKFRADMQMGCLYSENEVLSFSEHCGPQGEEKPKSRKLCDVWYEHDEYNDDYVDINGRDKPDTNTGLLFCLDECGISDTDINLRLGLKKSRWYFKHGIKIYVDNEEFYICQEVYFTNDEKFPYLRSGEIKVLPNAGQKKEEIISKYKFLNSLI